MLATLTIALVIVAGTASESCIYGISVELNNGSYNGVQYNDKEYVVENATGVERGCVCLKKTCVRKCCPSGFVYYKYTATKGRCEPTPEQFQFPVHRCGNTLPIEGFNITENVHFLYGKMTCDKAKGERRVIRQNIEGLIKVLTVRILCFSLLACVTYKHFLYIMYIYFAYFGFDF